MTTQRILKMGIAGIGVGTAGILPAMAAMPQMGLVAGADTNPRVRAAFQAHYGVRVYDSVEQLCADPGVEAIWIATPNRFHCPHTLLAAEHGKHVIVEKPMALSLAETEHMVEAAAKHNVRLLCGHTRAFLPAIQAMRRLISSGKLGRPCALHVWAYTDWMLRPRTAEELALDQGGVPYRQGPHPVDTIRLLGGGLVRSVRAMVG